MTNLWLQVTMNIAQLVQLVDTHEHLGGVKLGMFFLQYPRIVQQSPKVSSWDVFL